MSLDSIEAASLTAASNTVGIMAPSDEELVTAFQSGNIPAFDQLVRRWDRRIQGAIYRLAGNRDEA